MGCSVPEVRSGLRGRHPRRPAVAADGLDERLTSKTWNRWCLGPARSPIGCLDSRTSIATNLSCFITRVAITFLVIRSNKERSNKEARKWSIPCWRTGGHNPHPSRKNSRHPPSSSEGVVTAQECGLRCGFGGFGWVGLPAGITGAGIGPKTKGSTSLGQSDVSG